MNKKKRDYSAKFKVDFVLKALVYPDGVTAYCRKEGIKESRFYAWEQMILENNGNQTLHLSLLPPIYIFFWYL